MRWDIRRAYLEGLDQDESVPFSMQETELPAAGAPGGFSVRENVDAGVDVIDLTALRRELEAGRQKGGG